MGAGASFNIPDEAKIRERFLRITSSGVYANVLQIQDILPSCLDMYNVAVLFCLDDDRSGQFSIEKIIDFARKLNHCRHIFHHTEFGEQFEGYCTLRMWKSVSSLGDDHFTKWFLNVVREVELASEDRDDKSNHSLGETALRTVYRMLKVEEDAGLEFRKFYDFLCEETTEDTKRSDEQQDKVTMRAVEILALNFVKGIRTLMDEVGFETHQDEPALARCFGDEGEESVASHDLLDL